MNLKEYRQKAGLSQVDLSELSGVPVGTLRDWEQGRKPPTDVRKIYAVAKMLGVSIEELMGWKTRVDPLKELPQYFMERDEFVKIFKPIDDCFYEHGEYIDCGDFKTWKSEDELYILHLPSGTIVNWYKHCGRTNTCNKDLTKEECERFVQMFLEDMRNYEELTRWR